MVSPIKSLIGAPLRGKQSSNDLGKYSHSYIVLSNQSHHDFPQEYLTQVFVFHNVGDNIIFDGAKRVTWGRFLNSY